MLLSEVDGITCLNHGEDNPYFIQVDPAPFIVLYMGANLGTQAGNFDHPNLVAKLHEVHDYKHTSYNRMTDCCRKWWTSKPGINNVFVIPKDRIELLPESKESLSYPKVKIGGKVIRLNVSGGTFNDGWTDFIRTQVQTSVGYSTAYLKAVADQALSIPEAKALGVTLGPPRYPTDMEHWMELAAKSLISGKLKQGDTIYLRGSYSIAKSKGPFTIDYPRAKRKRYILVDKPYPTKVYYKHIDWTKTAEANGYELPGGVDINRLPTMPGNETDTV